MAGKLLNLTLKVWKQAGRGQKGKFEEYKEYLLKVHF